MTNGIRASDFSDMANNVPFDCPFNFNPYSSNSFQNPNLYHPYHYTPPPTPHSIYHSLQPPPQPSYQFYTTAHIPGYFTYQVGSQPSLTSCSFEAQLTSSCYMGSYCTAQHYQPEAAFVQQSETFTPQVFDENPNSHMQVDAIIDNMHQIEEKITKMLHTLEKMGKFFADSPKLVEKNMVGKIDKTGEEDSQSTELFSNEVNQSSNTPTAISIVDSPDDLCRVEKIVDDNSEDLKLLLVSTPTRYAHEVFDASSQTNSIVFAVESSVKAVNRYFVHPFIGYEMILISKLHENEYGKYCMKGRYKERDKGRFDGNKSPVIFKLLEPELYRAHNGMVHVVMEIDELPLKGKGKITWNAMITRYALNCIFNDTINLLGKREMEIDVNALVWFHPHDANMKDASINDLFTVKGHCRVLVLQYLLEEIIKAGKEISEEKWLDIVESLFWQATKLVELSNSSKGNLACVDYAKVKCIATTNPTKGIFIKGVAGTMKIRFKCMTSQYRNIGLFVLEGTIGYQKFPNQLAFVETLLQQHRTEARCLNEFFEIFWTLDNAEVQVLNVVISLINRTCSFQDVKWQMKSSVTTAQKKHQSYPYSFYCGSVTETATPKGDYQFVGEFQNGQPFTVLRNVDGRVFRRGNFKEVTSLKDYAMRLKFSHKEPYFVSGNGKEAVLSTSRVHDNQILVEIDVKMFFELEHGNVCNEEQYLNKLIYTLIVGFRWAFKGGTLVKEDIGDICSETQAPKQANGDLYCILNQKLGHVVEKMQKSGTPIYNPGVVIRSLNVLLNFTEATKLSLKKRFKMAIERCLADSLLGFVISYSGGQLLVVDTSYFDILWNLRKAELMVIEVYNLPNVMCKSSEVVKNIFYLGAELDSHDWTLNYVIVHAQSVEVIQILNAYKYRVSRQGSAKMDKVFLNRKELCKSISFDRVIAYHDVFQTTISSDEANKVQELILLKLSLGIRTRSVVIVFILTNSILPTQKKQVLSNYCDDQLDILLHVFKCERTGIKDHKLLRLFEFSGSPFAAKKIALSWYWYVAILVFDPGILIARRCLQIGFILEDKDDFKRGYLSRSFKRMILLILGLYHNSKTKPNAPTNKPNS